MKKVLLFLATTLFLVSNLYAWPGQVLDSLETGYHNSVGLTWDGQHLWLSDHKADQLACIDPTNGKIIRTLPSPGYWPAGLAWDGQYLWNLDSHQNKIFKVDPANGAILFSMDAPGKGPEGLTWDGATLWLSDARGKKLMRLDLSDGTAVKILDAPATNPQGLTWDGKYLWCADRIEDEIYMIDPESGAVLMILDAPGPYARGMAWDGKNLWNTDYQTDHLYKLVRQDNDQYRLAHTRHSLVTLTHQVRIDGPGRLQHLEVYFAEPQDQPQQEIRHIACLPQVFGQAMDKWQQPVRIFKYNNTGADSVITTVMQVDAQISAITYFIFPDQVGKLEDIPREILGLYTANGSKYQLNDPYIHGLSKTIVGDETNPYWMTRKIFDYVRLHLEYELTGGWNIAPVVLQRGNGSCSEYSFAFIALCRAAGIPARYVGAIVVRGDDASLDEVFHRWPEVYLPNYGWLPVDPQGGDKPTPREQAMCIGKLSNRFLITTRGGGDSEYLGWYYNYNESVVTDPQVHVNIDAFGEWEPLD